MNERVNESISRSIFNATRTGDGFNKIMRTGSGFNKIKRTGNGFNKVIMYILPSKQEREILFEATRTRVWLKLDVCSMCVRFPTQQRDTIGLINHQVKYFAKVNSAFTIFLHRRHGRFIVYQFKTVSLFSNRHSKVTNVYHLRRPRLPPSCLLLPRPDSIALNDRIKRASSAATQHNTKMMCHWIIHHLRTFPTG